MKRKRAKQNFPKPLISFNQRVAQKRFLHLVLPEVSERPNANTGNLPIPLTPFIGRQSEVEAVCRIISSPPVHLITLFGTAGTGKTRLSLAVAEKLLPKFRDGVFFVNLAPISKPELGLAAIAQVLGLQDHGQQPLLKKLQNYLHSREVLLVLDNLEQIVSLGSVISELLQAAPMLKVLVTSRVVLQLYGEYVYTVPTLSLPALSEEPSFESLSQNEAVRLFVQSASRVNSEFSLTEENASTIARLCVHLEGLPLAIELAAARCNVFSPQHLLDRLAVTSDTRLKLLNTGYTNLPRRQQSLAEAIQWSYQLLNESEKLLFRRAGIFAGSCTLAAAAEIAGTDTATTLETIISLLNKSLFKQVEAMPGEELRFTMLETIREFALERLIEAEEFESVRTTHSRYFTDTLEIAVDQLTKGDQINWLKQLEADHPNILSALDYLIEYEKAEEAFRLGCNIWEVWWRWGYLNQGRQWLNRLLKLYRAKVDTFLVAKLLDGVAYLAMYQSDYRVAEEYFQQSISLWREIGLNKYLSKAVSGLAGTYRILGNYERALELNYESLEICRALGDTIGVADCLCNIGWQLMERGNYDTVQATLEESLALHTEAKYLSGAARSKIYLGDILWRKNDTEQAIHYLEEALAMLREINHRIRLPSGLYRLGLMYFCQGKMAIAEKLFVEGIQISEEIYKPLDLTYAYSSLGLLRLVEGNLKEAEALFLQTLELRQEIGQLEAVLWAQEGLAVIALKQGKHGKAQEIMQEAQCLRQAISAPVLPHTIKYVLPELLGFQKGDKLAPRRIDKLTAKTPVTSGNLALKSPTPIRSAVTNREVSFGLDVGISLSERENEVLNLVAQGHSNIQIAQVLVISPGTVNNHLSSIYSKLGVNSRTAAIRYALDHDLL